MVKREREYKKLLMGITIIAMLLLAGSVAYAVNTQLQQTEREKNAAIMGYDLALLDLVKNANTCEPIKVTPFSQNTTVLIQKIDC